MKATLRTDGDIVRIARLIDKHLLEAERLIALLEESEHPNVAAIAATLNDNGMGGYTWATHCLHACLLHPERWKTSGNLGVPGISLKKRV